MANIFSALVGYFFSNDKKSTEEVKPLKYITAGNGTFEVRDNKLMTVAKKMDGVPKLPTIREGIQLHTPKIPFAVFNQIIAFTKKMYQKDSTESTIMVFYNEETKQFIPWIPIQENGSAASDYKRDDDPEYTRMCQENILVLVAHSHPWVCGVNGPTPSGIDDKDEKEAILYMVVGNVLGIPAMYVSTCPGGNRMKLKFFDVFENPIIDSNTSDLMQELLIKYVPESELVPRFLDVESFTVPDAWIARCKKKTYTYTGYGYGSGYNSSYGKVVHPAAWDYDGIDYDDYGGEYLYGGYAAVNKYIAEQNTGYEHQMQKREDARAAFEEILQTGEAYKEMEEATDVGDEGTAEVVILGEEDEVDDDDVANYGLLDVIDATLDFTNVQVAQLVFALIKEGKFDVIDRCLDAAMKQQQNAKEMAGLKASAAPGLKLMKHEEHTEPSKEE